MRPITECTNPQLKKIFKKSVEIGKVNLLLQEHLPHFLKNHCMVGSFNAGNLVIITHNSSIAYKLRFLIPELIDTLRKKGKLYQLTNIKIKISIHEPLYAEKKKITREISTISKKTIKDNALQIDFPPLRKALLKLID